MDCLTHVNCQANFHASVLFILPTSYGAEEDVKLLFLDMLVSRKADGTVGHTFYRKPTYTDRYLNKDSNHHPRQKRGIIKTLVERARRICDPEDIDKELKHLEEAFVANGYSSQEIKEEETATRRMQNSRVLPACHTFTRYQEHMPIMEPKLSQELFDLQELEDKEIDFQLR
ncbi:hypothetical protein NQ315_012913 [Exocentrus adspersus]|uniref:Helix-turn-helix domain-containing protein n=1 Tax=Exocentrus adspersus TaxID=1586481 RepID=A0AAV8VRP6_9CUCU|nr:hypothetical protein NQ315_012913 [Exocentrus adspersus]